MLGLIIRLCFLIKAVSSTSFIFDEMNKTALSICRSNCLHPYSNSMRTTTEPHQQMKFFKSCVSSCLNLTYLEVEEAQCNQYPELFEVNKQIPRYKYLCEESGNLISATPWHIVMKNGKTSVGLMLTVDSCEPISPAENTTFFIQTKRWDPESYEHDVEIGCYFAKLPKDKFFYKPEDTSKLRMNFIIDHAMAFDEEYKISLLKLPDRHALVYLRNWKSPSCFDINASPCLCSTEKIPLPDLLEVKVEGYQISMIVPLPLPCFDVKYIDVSMKLEESDSPKEIESTKMHYRYEYKNTNYTTEYIKSPVRKIKFDGLYEPKYNWYWSVQVIMYNHRPNMMRYSQFDQIKTWIPSTPCITVQGSNVDVSFEAASPAYNIKSYWLLVDYLSKYDYNLNNTDAKKTYLEVILKANETNDVVKKTLHCLNAGYYSFQIREFRDTVSPELSTKIKNSPWSDITIVLIDQPLQQDCLPALSGEVASLIVGSIVVLTLALVIIVACFYVWKKGLCYKVSDRLPSRISKWLDLQTFDSVSLHSCTVWLIWQFDDRSSELNDAHTENIRHFCSYLATVCGINVIIDLFEEEEMIQSYSKWIQHAYERAEYVVFICPHIDPSTITAKGDRVSSTVGNFHTAYLYLESLITNKKKYITVLFPYADAENTTYGRWLKNITINYRMMSDVEAFYFHLQGKSRMFINGRRTVEFINNKEYQDTNEGAALWQGFRQFIKLNESFKNGSLLVDDWTSSSDGSCKSLVQVASSTAPRISRLETQLKINAPTPSQVVYHKLDIVPPCGERENSELLLMTPSMSIEEKHEGGDAAETVQFAGADDCRGLDRVPLGR